MAASRISVQPISSLIDDKVNILVSGLAPKQTVTLEAKLLSDKGELFQSHAHYIADKDGEVDVCRDSSLGGSYSGVSPMGLLWSMKPAPGQRKGIRLMKSDVTKPYNIVLNCFDGHVTSHESSLQPLSSETFQKWYMADGVKRIPVREGRIRGTLFLPPGEGPFPGVIDMLGGPGGLVEFKASLLASRGIASLALAYFAYDDLPRNQLAMDMEYFEEAANWLSNHPKVLPHGIGVHASSYGALMALIMASLKMNAIKAIVAISPLVVAFFPYQYKEKISDVLPLENSKRISTEEGSVLRYAFSTVTDYKPSASKYPPIPPVENISCPVLLVYGTDDLNVNCDFSAELIFNRFKTHDKEHLCSILRYPATGHHLEPPYTPHCYASFAGASAKQLFGDKYLVWGGEMHAHAKAQEDAWPKILSFLRRNLQNSSSL
ncbi:hypothetical protein ACROYT_G017435 [Oculina patagonica]